MLCRFNALQRYACMDSCDELNKNFIKMDILIEIQNEEKELQTLVKDWGWQKLENFIEELIKKDRTEQLAIQGVSCSFLNELIEKHKANKKIALKNCKAMKDSKEYPWYDATFNNELLFVFDLEDLKIRSGL